MEKIHFVTGQLAANALRETLRQFADQVPWQHSIQVLPITVAALMTPAWIAKHIQIPEDASRIMLPGYCEGDLAPLHAVTELPIEIGPKDLRRLPEYFGGPPAASDYGAYDIEIIAEINHAPRLELKRVLQIAAELKAEGADRIDVGCEPQSCWAAVGKYVAALVREGHRVSIDSLNPAEIAPAVDAGADLVLSVNASNRDQAAKWGCEVVVIPDQIHQIESMQQTIDELSAAGVKLRIDPILEPIGFGFAASLNRYQLARQRWPEIEIMMGIGNLTELTDVDSAGVNVLLLAICQELGIRSVLTTQVINWARSCVRECDQARRLVHYAVNHRVPPKHLSDQLIMLRDPKLFNFGQAQLEQLAANIKDHNYRIFAETDHEGRNQIHLLGNRQQFSDRDPFLVFDQLAATNPKNLDASHAFYLGYEMCKAMMAIQLGKQYTQDEALNWGCLTVDEPDRHRLKTRSRRQPPNTPN